MRLLIDTHALIWFCEGNTELSHTARAAIENPMNERFVSHATAWEVAIKLNLGKLKLQLDYDAVFPGILDANGFSFLHTTLPHYQTLVSLTRHHGDPFDRLMIAQAMVEKLTIITCDPHFPSYGVAVLW
jgi:PIN domain nuclease of toxin-antitoxin system